MNRPPVRLSGVSLSMIPRANIMPALGPPMSPTLIFTVNGKLNFSPTWIPNTARPRFSFVPTWTCRVAPLRFTVTVSELPAGCELICLVRLVWLVTAVPLIDWMMSPACSLP
jgi:hypothetical protein